MNGKNQAQHDSEYRGCATVQWTSNDILPGRNIDDAAWSRRNIYAGFAGRRIEMSEDVNASLLTGITRVPQMPARCRAAGPDAIKASAACLLPISPEGAQIRSRRRQKVIVSGSRASRNRQCYQPARSTAHARAGSRGDEYSHSDGHMIADWRITCYSAKPLRR